MQMRASMYVHHELIGREEPQQPVNCHFEFDDGDGRVAGSVNGDECDIHHLE